MLSEFLFKFFDGVSPVDWLGSLVMIRDVVGERTFKGTGAGKMIGLQVLPLKNAEPNFDLIEPGSVGRQPEDLKVEVPVTNCFLLAQPAFELFGRVGRAVVQKKEDRLDLAPQGFGNDLLLDKGLEIDKAFALPTQAVDLAIGDGEASKQLACAAPLIARFVQYRLAWASRARRLLALAGLDRSFLVEAEQPGSCLQECACLGIGIQHGARPLQEGDRIMDMLPGMVAPGTQAFGFEPAAHRAGRDARQAGILRHSSRQFSAAPARERHLVLLGQTTGDGRHLRAHLRGKNASAPRCAGHRPANGF